MVGAVWMRRAQNLSIVSVCSPPDWTCIEVRGGSLGAPGLPWTGSYLPYRPGPWGATRYARLGGEAGDKPTDRRGSKTAEASAEALQPWILGRFAESHVCELRGRASHAPCITGAVRAMVRGVL